jgi:hypothetical protein
MVSMRGVLEVVMSDFEQALRNKISVLEDERQELEDALNRVGDRIRLLEEFLAEESGGKEISTTKPSKRRGRPKKSRTKPKKAVPVTDDLYEEAVSSLEGEGTTPEQQERALKRYKPFPREKQNYGPGVRAGSKEQIISGANKSPNASVTAEDGDE